MIVWNLIGGAKGAAIILIILALLGWAGWKTYEVYDAKKEATTAIEARDKALLERDTAIEANKKNEAVITQLTSEKTLIQSALNNLEARQRTDAVTIGRLSTIIQDQSKNPANQVQLSPVLQAVVSQIQQDRAKRAEVTK